MKYTILPGIVRTEVCGETMLVACGSARGKAPYARTLNETAAFLWKQLELGRDEAAIIAALTEEYGIDEQTARAKRIPAGRIRRQYKNRLTVLGGSVFV